MYLQSIADSLAQAPERVKRETGFLRRLGWGTKPNNHKNRFLGLAKVLKFLQWLGFARSRASHAKPKKCVGFRASTQPTSTKTKSKQMVTNQERIITEKSAWLLPIGCSLSKNPYKSPLPFGKLKAIF
jgi:hypothetical protein